MAALAPDARSVAIAGPDNLLRLVDATSGEELVRNYHHGRLRAVRILPGGDCRFVTDDADGSLHAWLFGGARETVEAVAGAVEVVPRLDVALDGRLLGKTIVELKTMQSRQIPDVARTPPPGSNEKAYFSPSSFAFSPNGRFIVTNHFDNVAEVWETASQRHVTSLPHPAQTGQSTNAFAFSPDGRYLARLGTNVHVWAEWSNATPRSHRIDAQSPRRLAFSADGRYLAVVDGVGRVRLYATPSFALTSTFAHAAGEAVTDIAFSGDGRMLAIVVGVGNEYRNPAGFESYVEVWNVDGRQRVGRWSHGSPTNRIRSLDIAADGGYVVTAGGDRTVRLWQTATGLEVVRLAFLRNVPNAVFSADGKYIVVRSGEDPRDVPAAGGQYTRIITLENDVVSIGHGDLIPAIPNERAISRWLWRPRDLIAEACARLRTDLSEGEWRLYGAGRSVLGVCGR